MFPNTEQAVGKINILPKMPRDSRTLETEGTSLPLMGDGHMQESMSTAWDGTFFAIRLPT